MLMLLSPASRRPLTEVFSSVLRLFTTAATTTATASSVETQMAPQTGKSIQNYHYLRSPYSIIYHYYKAPGCYDEAKSLVSQLPKIRRVTPQQLDHLLELLKGGGHSWEEVQECKEVLLLSPTKFTQRVHLLQDFSLARPTLFQVLGVSRFMDSSMKAVKESCEGRSHMDLLDHLLARVSRDPGLLDDTAEDARTLFSRDEVTLRQVYLYLLRDYLAWRFHEERDTVGSFLEHAPIPTWKPLMAYRRICDIIIKRLGFSFFEVREQPALLNLNPENSEEVLSKIRTIGGTQTEEVVRKHPRILQMSAAHLQRWLYLLQKYHVRRFIYTHQATLLFNTYFFPEVEERLRTLEELPEWEVIMASDKLFDVLRNKRHVKMLLNAVESGQVITSLSSITKSYTQTKQKSSYKVPPEIVAYVAAELELKMEETKELLRNDLYTSFGIANTKAVLRLLLDYGFSREQVVCGMVVLSLEVGVVEQALKEFHARPEAQPFAEWMESPFVLQLLAYCINRDLPHLDLPLRR